MSIPALTGLALALWFPLAFAFTSARVGHRGGTADRAGVVSNLVLASAAVVAAYALVPWQTVPAGLWSLLVAATVFGVAAAAVAWPALPTLAGKHPRWRVAGTVVNVVLASAAVALFVTA